MPRRAPPSSLHLTSGPMPRRGEPKHTLPSLPRPTFQPATTLTTDPLKASPPRRRKMELSSLPPLVIPQGGSQFGVSHFSSAMHLPYGGGDSGSRRQSTESNASTLTESAPWNHTKAFGIFDIDALLPAPKRVAVSPS